MKLNHYLVIVLELLAVSTVAIGCLSFVKPTYSLQTETYYVIQR